MKAKNITLSILLNALMISASCSGMDYLSNSYNSITNMIQINMMVARHWTSNFFNRCWKVGVLATVYASFGKYDFKKITGLDENKLDTYNPEEIKQGINRVKMMIEYSAYTAQLETILQKLEAQLDQKEVELSYDETATIQEIEKLIQEKRK